jgi:SAM-dependent methyltransferase
MQLAVGGDTATPINLSCRSAIMREHVAPDNYVLDVGCGRGEYVRNLLTLTANTYGIETSAEKLQDCLRLHPELSDRLFAVSVEKMPFPHGCFDVVIVNEALEHISDQAAALAEIRRVLKRDGKLLLFCPNRLFPFETHGFLIRGRLRKWIPWLNYLPIGLLGRVGIEQVARNYWPREVKALLERHGFRVEQRAFVQQTFENISGVQPHAVKSLRPLLRHGFRFLGKIPGMRAFVSVSSFLVAKA